MSSIVIRAPKIALVSGSLRQGSFNTQLIAAAQSVLDTLGAETHHVSLQDYDNLPLYSQDLEAAQGMPAAAVALKQALGTADAWVVSSPEYNGFPTPLLLNAYTWCSRGDADGDMYATFRNKTALVTGASPGAMGGLRAIAPHRQFLQNLGVHVTSHTVAIGKAFHAFATNEEGQTILSDEKQRDSLHAALEALYYKARDEANRDAACDLIQAHWRNAGEYGAVSTPTAA